MSLLFIDSCGDTQQTSLGGATPLKYDSGSASTITGRHGRCYQYGASLRHIEPTPADNTLIFGQAIYVVAISGLDKYVILEDTGVVVCELRSNADAAFQVFIPKTLAGYSDQIVAQSANAAFRAGQWMYLEWQIKLAEGTSGATKLWLNGELLFNVTSIQTYPQAILDNNGVGEFYEGWPTTYHWTSWILGYNGSSHNIDDVYVLDSVDENPGEGVGDPRHYNAPLGDIEVDKIVPNGAGNSTMFTPSAGSNWQNCDEATPDDDTTYNKSTAVADEDLFAMEDISTGDTVLAVQQMVVARRTDEGFATIQSRIRQSGTTYSNDSKVLSTTYNSTRKPLGLAPDGTHWTDAKVNAIEMGYKRTA